MQVGNHGAIVGSQDYLFVIGFQSSYGASTLPLCFTLARYNSSIKLTASLSLDNKNYTLVNKLEKKLSDLDIVANYYIDKFSGKKIIFKVIYNSTPDIFIKEITSAGFNVDHSSPVWLLK